MQKLLFGGIAIALMMATPALGADLPAKALPYKSVPIVEVPTWTGFYVGAELGANWSSTTAVQVYTVHDFHPLMARDIAVRGAARSGLTWHYCRPPVVDIDYEMDCRGVAIEHVAD